MATEKWIGGSGQGLTWGNAFSTATLSAIASGNAILSDVAISNGTPLDIFADLSLNLAAITTVAPNFVGVYVYPLNDASVYGDGRFGSSAAGPPPNNYSVGNIGLYVATSTAQTGVLSRIVLPPGTFKFVLWNQSGVAFATGSVNTCLYRTYNRSVA